MTGGERVPRVDRMTRDAWAWRSGEHETFLGPAGSGKVQLGAIAMRVILARLAAQAQDTVPEDVDS